jgi:hypothetical protein
LELERVNTELREKQQEQLRQSDEQEQLQYEKDNPKPLNGFPLKNRVLESDDHRRTEYAILPYPDLKNKYKNVYEEHKKYTKNPLPNYFDTRSYLSLAKSYVATDAPIVIEKIILMEDFIKYAKESHARGGGKSKSKRIIKSKSKSKSKHRIKKGNGKGKKTHLHRSTRRH